MDKPSNRKIVVFGFLGTQLDYAGKGVTRWEKWRPTVGLCQQEDLLVHRIELLHDARNRGDAERVRNDIRTISPETLVRSVETQLRDPWDFEEVYGALLDLAQRYPFDLEN